MANAGEKEARLDFLLLLYRIFAEYISIRLRLTNEELVRAKREAKRSEMTPTPPKPKSSASKRYIENL
jgi:hypothetical protein